jgi:hypothetical protein
VNTAWRERTLEQVAPVDKGARMLADDGLDVQRGRIELGDLARHSRAEEELAQTGGGLYRW